MYVHLGYILFSPQHACAAAFLYYDYSSITPSSQSIYFIMALPRLLGHANTTFTHHPSTISLQAKDPASPPSNLAFLCESVTPPCHLNPLLFNGHLQTCYTVIKNQDIPVYYKRRIFSATDPTYAGTFAVDFVVPPYEGSDEHLPPRTTYLKDVEFEDIGADDEKPMLITLHGLSGGSHEIYLRHVFEPLFKAGWEACVVNSRGCAMSKITSGVLFNARSTWDLRQMVKWLREKFPKRPLFGIGYSLGANIMINVRTRYGTANTLQFSSLE